ncbi:hypothetical protein R3I94_011867 [Phoxinus phoxinus]
MNKILILCLGILIINLSFSTQQVSTSNTTSKPDDSPATASATGLGPWPTVLCLLIPSILAFIHSRS